MNLPLVKDPQLFNKKLESVVMEELASYTAPSESSHNVTMRPRTSLGPARKSPGGCIGVGAGVLAAVILIAGHCLRGSRARSSREADRYRPELHAIAAG